MRTPAPSRSVLRTIAVATTVASLGVMSPARSMAPLHVAYDVDISYPLDDLAAVCGFDVEFHMVGVFKGTLRRNAAGTIVSEFDSQPNTTQTFSSPESGKSFSFKFSTTFHSSYPDGIEPGDRVISKISGAQEKLPGLPARAGRAYFPDGEVLFVDDGGVPIVTYGEPTREVRRKYSDDQADAAICSALAP